MQRVLQFLTLAMVLALGACNAETSDHVAQSAEIDVSKLQNGIDYELLSNPVPTVDDTKIEVTEIFWYGCIHCYNLEPKLEGWLPTLGDDVVFNPVPAIWHPSMELHARMYYANQALGLYDQLHGAIFEAMNDGNKRFASEDEVLDWVEDQGVDPDAYSRAMNSFGVNSQINQVQAKMVSYNVRGTPELVVNGKYHLTTTLAKTQDNMLVIASALIEQERTANAQ